MFNSHRSAYGAALVPLALAGVPVAAPQAYALVGMAGVLAGICRVPLTAILLLFELTHDYRIIVPLMGTVGVSSLGFTSAPAVVAMAEALLSGDPADKPTLVATGALTNVALLFSVYPEVIHRLDELVIMGGAYQGLGNTGPTSEFNIQCDPEAAHIVFEAGLKSLVMVPLEVTHTVLVTPEIRNKYFKGSRFRILLDELMHFFEESYKKVFGFDHPPLHDPVAVFYVMLPAMFKTKRMRVDIDCGQLCAGTTVCDHYGMSGKEPNVTVCTKVDVDTFWKTMAETVAEADKVSPINSK